MFQRVDPAIWNISQEGRGMGKAFRKMEIGDVIEVPYRECHSNAKRVGVVVQTTCIEGKFYAKRVK